MIKALSGDTAVLACHVPRHLQPYTEPPLCMVYIKEQWTRMQGRFIVALSLHLVSRLRTTTVFGLRCQYVSSYVPSSPLICEASREDYQPVDITKSRPSQYPPCALSCGIRNIRSTSSRTAIRRIVSSSSAPHTLPSNAIRPNTSWSDTWPNLHPSCDIFCTSSLSRRRKTWNGLPLCTSSLSTRRKTCH